MEHITPDFVSDIWMYVLAMISVAFNIQTVIPVAFHMHARSQSQLYGQAMVSFWRDAVQIQRESYPNVHDPNDAIIRAGQFPVSLTLEAQSIWPAKLIRRGTINNVEVACGYDGWNFYIGYVEHNDTPVVAT